MISHWSNSYNTSALENIVFFLIWEVPSFHQNKRQALIVSHNAVLKKYNHTISI